MRQLKFYDFYDVILIPMDFLLFYKDAYYAGHEKEIVSFRFITGTMVSR